MAIEPLSQANHDVESERAFATKAFNGKPQAPASLIESFALPANATGHIGLNNALDSMGILKVGLNFRLTEQGRKIFWSERMNAAILAGVPLEKQ